MKYALSLALLLAACGREDEKQAAYPFDPAYKPEPAAPPAKVKPSPAATPLASPTVAPTPQPTVLPAPSRTRLTVRWREGDVAIGWDSQGNRLPRTTEGLVAKQKVFEVVDFKPAGLVLQHDSFPGQDVQKGKSLCTPVRSDPAAHDFEYECDLDVLKRNCTIDVAAGVYHFLPPSAAEFVSNPVWTVRFDASPGGWCATLD